MIEDLEGQRIMAYTTSTEGGVVVDVEGMMVDLVTFVKAMAIQAVVAEGPAKERFFVALEEVWENCQVTAKGPGQGN